MSFVLENNSTPKHSNIIYLSILFVELCSKSFSKNND